MDAVTVAPAVVSNVGQSTPVFGVPPPSYVRAEPSHVLLTPFILPESIEALLSSGAFGGQTGHSIKSVLKKLAGLPLLVIVPSLFIVAGTLWCLFFNLLPTYFPNFWKKLLTLVDTAAPVAGTTTTTTQKPFQNTFGPFLHYFNTGSTGPYSYAKRPKRATEDEAAKPASGLPVLSMAQVEKLTEIVFAALRSQQCIQRLLCEAGTLSRSYSETAHSVAKIVERFVPESIKDSYEIFANADKCDRYICGSLYVKK